MTRFTAIVTYPDGRKSVAWTPRKPTPGQPCNTGDQITFQSPRVMSHLRFRTDSPFEPAKGTKTYEVKKGASLDLKIDPRAKNTTFVFDCMPDGVLLPGVIGDDVPVGSP